MEATFLSQLANELLINSSESLYQTTIVLPNKRAKLFLIEELKKQSNETFLAPQIISIESLIEEIAQLRALENIELLFEFYIVYLELTEQSKQQDFERFSSWAITILQDFNEIDRYLVNQNELFSYLLDIERIKHWTPNINNQSALVENHLEFWKLLPTYYDTFTQHLLLKKVGYQGLLYRKSAENIVSFTKQLENKSYVFAGFNALNNAEETIIKHLLENNKAKVYWDIDAVFLKDEFHDAGLFLRRIKKTWKHFESNPFNWVMNEFSKEKNIEVIGTPKSIGQAKIAGKIIEKIAQENSSLQNTAVVLSEENILIPLLNSLPAEVENLNITMGYPSKNNPAQILIFKLFNLHLNAQKRNQKQSVFYYKEVLEILNNPLVVSSVNANEVVKIIKNSNLTFITEKRLTDLFTRYNLQNNALVSLLFFDWQGSITQILDKLKAILIFIKEHLNNQNEQDKVTKAFVFSIYNIIIKISNYYETYQNIDTLEILFSIYKQVIDQAQVSFEGEPLQGLQIMGILESRVLDFENVIITSLNEGKLPGGKSNNSFIPYDVKLEKGLPTYKERDAIFTYHFYRLLQRAKNIYLLYNTHSEGIDAGEKSRFITQLEIEHLPNHHFKKVFYNAIKPDTIYQPIEIVKTESILNRLKEIATVKGFSPSALTNYLRNPIQFYYQRILGVRENEEVEENVAVNTLGTIIHEVLEKMYQPFEGKNIQIKTVDIENMIQNIEAYTLEKFIEVYKEGEIKKGKNLIAFEVAKRNIYNFLLQEKLNLENGDELFILSLEKEHAAEITHPNLPYPIRIAGKVDRIELRNNTIRIIDYKTGKVEAKKLKIATFEGLTLDLANDKIIQLLCYALMFQKSEWKGNYNVEVGIISFKNMKAGFLPFTFGAPRSKDVETVITPEFLELFTEELVILIQEILNPDVSFKEVI
ncbi:PD-(D/E)XK nuclease family protein [Flavobacterium urocaniciphilum]|uniref:PD-(D/E)XK nuclease superfamily protein n=1 Tax=Flavobacterium urocaniciphilum TaxID=1299341 RepID=A0A1H9BHK3_9FLAO|nr:PD-(D/E)XK nuclease family protein [Flavobacterium urocaniciphilum]SEP88464.1 PD-(D/E)XK nuclease superfamily protein [Flavobacterium urocaniciphilum]